MYFEQITTPGLGCFSYAVGCPLSGTMAIVDPRRDIGVYLRIAEENNMRITHIFDTHVHADHISGAQQLRAATGADIYIHESAPVNYEAKRIKDGDEFTFGNGFIRVLHTPGHTPNSVSLLVSDLVRSPEPEMILTGDLLFVGDIGRPDLPGEKIMDEQIENLYNSLFKVLGQLPDYLEVYPAHGQGSLCGQGMSAKPSSSLGYERLTNPMLLHTDFKEFKEAILSNLPMRPQSFAGIIPANMDIVPIIPLKEDLSGYALSVTDTEKLLQDGVTILDLRDELSFSAAHIPGSIHVNAVNSAMLNWIGVVIAPETPFLLILPSGKDFAEMRLEMQRIGYDITLKGWLKGGVNAWLSSGRETKSLPHISVTSLMKRLTEGNPPALIDVRNPKEFKTLSIAGSVNLPFEQILAKNYSHDMINKEVVVVCQSGFRASIAASLLQGHGWTDLTILSGGMNAWTKHN